MGTSSSTGNVAGTSPREGHQKHRELFVPRGLDLLPSMRAPRYLPSPISATSKGNSGGGDGTTADAGQKAVGTKEYVPWIGGSASLSGRFKAGKMGRVAATGVAAAGVAGVAATAPVRADDGEDRVQWFPRGLPKEAAPEGRGQDERESAMYNTRVSVAIDRLGEQVRETTKRQAEMEVKRREKVCSRLMWLTCHGVFRCDALVLKGEVQEIFKSIFQEGFVSGLLVVPCVPSPVFVRLCGNYCMRP